MKSFYVQQKGYSLIEVMVAVGLLMFAIVGPMTIAVKSSQSALYARQQNTAFFLAQESISIMNAIRNDAALAVKTGAATDPWAWVTNPALTSCKAAYGCNIDAVDSTFLNNITSCQTATNCTLSYDESAVRGKYRVGTGEVTPFRRIITLQEVTPYEVLVTSKVEWEARVLGGVQTVSLNTSLLNAFK
jgi:Tfp pilus assembly protein PilV